jgi:hypothetical protein
MRKKISKKHHKKENPIYSKIEYENAYRIKVNILKLQESLLNVYQSMDDYKTLRKKEMILKLKLRSEITETKKLLIQLTSSMPQTPGIKKIRKEIIKENEEIPKQNNMSIETQLEEIKRRLQELA